VYNDALSRQKTLTIALLVCFFLSGATSLTLEVVWVRLFTQVFGSTNLAIATVLATFMAGMAVGSWLGGRIADRFPRDPLWVYAACEVGIAISAIIVPWFLGTFPGINAWLWGQFADWPMVLSLLRALLCVLLLIIPTTFMGATLPVLSKAVVRSTSDFDRIGAKVATLYAINTAGAVTGAFCAGFWLLPALGLGTLHWLGVLSALTIGLLAASLARWRNAAGTPEVLAAQRTRTESLDARLALAAFACSGAVAMALESLFSRAMALVLGSAIQSFTLVLVLFLVGLSIGAAAMGRVAARMKEPLSWLALVMAIAGAMIVLVYFYLDALPQFHHDVVRWADVDLDSAAGIAVRALVAAAIAPVTIFLGAIMPIAVTAYASSGETVGGDVGRAYSVNTIGAVIGSMAGGFFLLPAFGIGGGLMACALALVAVSMLLSLRSKSSRMGWTIRGVAALTLLLIVVVPSMDVKRINSGMFAFLGADDTQWRSFQKGNKLVYTRDGRASTISVFENADTFALLNNGKPDGSSHEDVHTQILLGMLPAMLSPVEKSNAFVIGYGTGMTVGSLTRAPNVDQVDVVEIEEAVYEAADLFFGEYTHDPHKNPKVKRHVGDGRNFLMYRSPSYGIIVSEPPDIWVAGVASLFSHEFYEAVRKHLEPNGIFCQWVPLYHLRPSTIRMVYRTLSRSFPHVHVFVLSNGNSIVLASETPIPISMDTLDQRFANQNAKLELHRAGIAYPTELLTLLALNPVELLKFAGEGPIHTDDNGALEFAAQSDYLFSVRSPENSAQLKEGLSNAFAPFGDLRPLQIDMGEGEKAKLRSLGLANELMRAGRPEHAKYWVEQSAD
jgi:spermidine synthase